MLFTHVVNRNENGCLYIYIRVHISHSYRWCIVTGIFLMYRTIDIVMINICRILLCVFQTVGKPICKLLVLAHCLIWLVDFRN